MPSLHFKCITTFHARVPQSIQQVPFPVILSLQLLPHKYVVIVSEKLSIFIDDVQMLSSGQKVEQSHSDWGTV